MHIFDTLSLNTLYLIADISRKEREETVQHVHAKF